MKAVSRKNISFPSLGFKMKAGKETELPKEKEAQEAILASVYVTKAGTAKTDTKGKVTDTK